MRRQRYGILIGWMWSWMGVVSGLAAGVPESVLFTDVDPQPYIRQAVEAGLAGPQPPAHLDALYQQLDQQVDQLIHAREHDLHSVADWLRHTLTAIQAKQAVYAYFRAHKYPDMDKSWKGAHIFKDVWRGVQVRVAEYDSAWVNRLLYSEQATELDIHPCVVEWGEADFSRVMDLEARRGYVYPKVCMSNYLKAVALPPQLSASYNIVYDSKPVVNKLVGDVFTVLKADQLLERGKRSKRRLWKRRVRPLAVALYRAVETATLIAGIQGEVMKVFQRWYSLGQVQASALEWYSDLSGICRFQRYIDWGRLQISKEFTGFGQSGEATLHQGMVADIAASLESQHPGVQPFLPLLRHFHHQIEQALAQEAAVSSLEH